MDIKTIFTGLIFMAANLYADGPQNYFFVENGKKVAVKVLAVESVNVNEVCEKDKTCKALKIFKGKSFTGKLKNVIQGNYAGTYCKLVSGSVLILIDKDGSQYEYCEFKDKSMIDAWALYNTHSKTTKAKKGEK